MSPIIESSCREQCHDSQLQGGDLDLSEGRAYSALVDVASTQAPLDLVEPGDAEKSYLWHKVNGSHVTVGGEGEAMPYATGQLSADLLEQIRQAIEELPSSK